MKISKIALAVAATAVAVSSHAVPINGGVLTGVGTDNTGGGISGVSAVAIVSQGPVIRTLQTLQGFPAGCIGNLSKLCAPSLSSAEVRGLLNNSWSSSNFVTVNGAALTPALFANGVTKTLVLHGRSTSGNVDDALHSFVQSGDPTQTVDTLVCGQGAALEVNNSNVSGATDADVLTKVDAATTKTLIGFVHATELDDSTYSNVGFIKLDGVAPDLVNLLSGNYNLVSNLHGALPGSTTRATNGTTVGAAAIASGNGVAFHNFGGSATGCAPLDTDSSVADGGTSI